MLARPARPVLSRLEPATPRLILEPLPLPAPPGHVSSSHFTVHEPHQHIAVSRLRVQGASTARVQADTSLPQPVRTRGPHTHPAYAVLTLTPTCSSGDSASPCFGLQEFLGAPGGAVEEVQEGNASTSSFLCSPPGHAVLRWRCGSSRCRSHCHGDSRLSSSAWVSVLNYEEAQFWGAASARGVSHTAAWGSAQKISEEGPGI